MRLHKVWRWPAFELLRERCISLETPVALRPHAVCLRTDSQEVFAGLGGRGTWGTFITDVSEVWCTWAEEDGSVVWTAVSKHLSLGWWRRRIHKHNDFFHYSEIRGAREVFWAHVNVSPPCCLKPIKNLGILSEVWKSDFLPLLVFSCDKENWGRGNRTCFGHLWFMVMLGCVSTFLVLVSSLVHVPDKMGGNMVGFSQSLLLSGRFALEILC